jgi:hypothetical protein
MELGFWGVQLSLHLEYSEYCAWSPLIAENKFSFLVASLISEIVM